MIGCRLVFICCKERFLCRVLLFLKSVFVFENFVHVLIRFTSLSQLLQDPHSFLVHPTLCLFFLILKFNLCCPNILGHVAFHWNVVNLAGATLFQKTASSSLTSKQLKIAPWLGMGFSVSYSISMLGLCLNCSSIVFAHAITTAVNLYV